MAQMHEVDEDMDGRLKDMICDTGESSFMKAYIFDTLCIEYLLVKDYTYLSIIGALTPLDIANLRDVSGGARRRPPRFELLPRGHGRGSSTLGRGMILCDTERSLKHSRVYPVLCPIPMNMIQRITSASRSHTK